MEKLGQVGVAVGYSFAAWLFAALVVYAAASRLTKPWSVAAHCAGLLVTFGPVFTLYFRGPRPLPPLPAAGLAVGFVALLDVVLLSPHFMHVYDPFLSFWDWQLPAAFAAGSVYLAGRRAEAYAGLK